MPLQEQARPVVKETLPFYYVIVVWGDRYVDMLLELAIPTFLSPRNLPGLSNLKESRFLILATPADRARIENAPIFEKLRAVIEPVFIDLHADAGNGTQQLKAAYAHRVAAEIAARNDAFCIYLCPDCLLSDGSLSFLESVARNGKKAVLVPGLRLVRESVYAELRERGVLKPGIPMTFSSRELVEFGLRHLHREIERYNWDHPEFALYPHLCTWTIPGEHGLLIRAFHLHPIMIAMKGAEEFSSLEYSTIDGEFIGYNVTDWDLIQVETDSDNLAIFSLNDMHDRIEVAPRVSSRIDRLRAIATSGIVTPLHRYYFSKAIKMHCDDLNEKWALVEKQSGHIMYEILKFAPVDPQSYLPYVRARSLVAELQRRLKRRLARMLGIARG